MTDQASPALWRFIQDDAPDAFTLIVETANGQYVRRIRPALPLPSGVEHGPGAEAAAHTAAITWGLSDFVFKSAYASKGSGRRELGDRLLVAGGRGAVIQVKARTIQPKDTDSEVAWIQKVATKAVRQAKGTVRQLRILPADMTNGRDRILSVVGNAYKWIGVFLLDHEQVPEGAICSLEPIGFPTIALTRRDWDFLFDQLRSTTAVLDYLFRAAVEPPVALSEEPVVLRVRRGRRRGPRPPQPRCRRTRRNLLLHTVAPAGSVGVGSCSPGYANHHGGRRHQRYPIADE